jgi:hypothetical protein
MNSFPPTQPAPRAPRAHFAEPTPAVLRLKDGRRVAGNLKVVSLTGGLLSVARAIDAGSNAKVMFLTQAGMVLGSAEMLSPVSLRLQAFRFIALHSDDQNRLKTAIQRFVDHNRTDQSQIEPSRAW